MGGFIMKITKPELIGLELLLAIGAYLIHPILSVVTLLFFITTWSL